MRANDPVVTLTGTKLGETGKAVRFTITHVSGVELEKSRTEWFPFSQIQKLGTSDKTAGEDYLVVSEWIMGQKGIATKNLATPVAKEQAQESDSYDPWDDCPAF